MAHVANALRRSVLVAGVLLSAPVFLSSAMAQQESQAEREYDTVIGDAIKEYKLGNWEEARALFKHAHGLKPSSRTLRGLGMTCFEGRRYLEAIEAFRGALEERRKPLTDEMRAQIEKLLKRAKRYVGRIALDVVPASASVTVENGKILRDEGELFVEPGERVLVASAEGYQTLKRKIKVDVGDTVALKLTLQKAIAEPPIADASRSSKDPLAASRSMPPDRTGDDHADQGSNLLPWVVIGASGAVAVGGAVLFGIGLSDISQVENVEEGTFYEEIKDADERAPTFTTVGAVLFGVGVAGAAVGVVLLSLGDDGESAASKLSLTPAGIQVRGVL